MQSSEFCSQNDRFDTIIRNGQVIDGTGAAPIAADVCVTEDRIAFIGDASRLQSAVEVDARGKVVCPGFIDVHTHDDRAVLANPLLECKISQGVTTVVTGNCGISIAPLKIDHRPPPPLDLICDEPGHFFQRFKDYLQALRDDPPAVNVVAQVGHSTLRVATMEDLGRTATQNEIAQMRSLAEQAIADGAIGMSTGLFYPPAKASATEEIVKIAKSLAKSGAIYTTHMRDEADYVMASLEESFHIGLKADVPVVISHHKCAGVHNHGRSRETLAYIDIARKKQPIGLDVYPYIAASTVLDSHWVTEAEKVLVTWSDPIPEAAGRELADLAQEWNMSIQEAADAILPAGGVFYMMSEEDVQAIMKYPHTMIGSDGLPHDTHPHPRLWGTFPRVLGHYSRDCALFPMEEAVHRMTGLSARQFGLKDRGVIRAGAFADLVIFDPREIADRATFAEPTKTASGIETVIVNGRVAWNEGGSSGARPGRVLRREAISQDRRHQEE